MRMKQWSSGVNRLRFDKEHRGGNRSFVQRLFRRLGEKRRYDKLRSHCLDSDLEIVLKAAFFGLPSIRGPMHFSAFQGGTVSYKKMEGRGCRDN